MRPNTLIFGQDERVAKWVARQLPQMMGTQFGECRAVAIVSGEGRPLGAVVYHDYAPAHGTVAMSIATISPLWAQKATVRDLLAIPFDQYKCRKIWVLTTTGNDKAERLLRKIGMKREAVLREQVAPKTHGVIYGMLAHEYRAKWRLKDAA